MTILSFKIIMDSTVFYNLRHRQIRLIEEERRSSLPATLLMTSTDTSFQSNDRLSITNNHSNEDRRSLINRTVCNICQKSCSLNELNICPGCHQNQSKQNSDDSKTVTADRNNDKQVVQAHSFHIFNRDKKSQTEKKRIEIAVDFKDKCKKRLNYQLAMRLLNFYRYRQSLPDIIPKSATSECIYKLLLQPKLSINTTITETIQCSQTPPSAPRTRYVSTEHINNCKQRHLELSRTVQQLIESLKTKTKCSINQISKDWPYLKQKSLNEFYPKTNFYQMFGYLLQFSSPNKQSEFYLEENDEINAALRVLSTTLTITNNKYSFCTISQLFDQEEKSTIENLQDQLEGLLSSYIDELSFITERIQFYQSCPNAEKNFEWVQIIKQEYPSLIERISNDFITKTPQIEKILIQMLRNMKKRLLSININTR
jgi:hypothetical protein